MTNKQSDALGYSIGLESRGFVAEAALLRTQHALLEQSKAALEDMNNGWKYIRRTHGDLYGVGWDRAQEKADSALAALNQHLDQK